MDTGSRLRATTPPPWLSGKRTCWRPSRQVPTPRWLSLTPRLRHTSESRPFRASSIGVRHHVSNHPGTDRHHLPRRSRREERDRDLSLLPGFPCDFEPSPVAPALPLGRAVAAALHLPSQPVLYRN